MLARQAGLALDDWQAQDLSDALGVRADGKLAAKEVGLVAARQNGKGTIIEAAELFWLFVAGERKITHTAHEFKTSKDAYDRVAGLIADTPHLNKRVRNYYNSNENTSIVLNTGARLRFIARSKKGGGRGLGGGKVILDEALYLTNAIMNALFPLMSAQPDWQIWYTSTVEEEGGAGDPILRGIRGQALSEDPPGNLCYLEHSAPEGADPFDWDAIAQANPGLGTRISHEYVQTERNRFITSNNLAGWKVERMSLWPPDPRELKAIEIDAWDDLADPPSEDGKHEGSQITGRFVFAVAVARDRTRAMIGVAGETASGRVHLEPIDIRRGVRWLPERLKELVDDWGPAAVAIDPGSPAGSLVVAIEALGIELLTCNAREYAQACGSLMDMIDDALVVHVADPDLDAAVASATTRPLGDLVAWKRDNTLGEVMPLECVTVAAWGLAVKCGEAGLVEEASVYERRGMLVLG